jgi:hypothetical protein
MLMWCVRLLTHFQGMLHLQVPPTVLVRVSHPIFHQAVDSTPAPLRPSGGGMHLRRSSSGTMDGAQHQQQEGKLGSLQVCARTEFHT